MRSVAFSLAFVAATGCSGSSGGGGSAFLTNHGLGAATLQGNGELWVVGVSEADEGARDRNGDGDTSDVVLSVLDLADGSLTHLGLATSPLPLLAVGAVLIAFGVPEASQGQADRNGDGDTQDTVLHVYDSGTRAVTNTGLAMTFFTPAIGAGAVAFAVSEAGQGGLDLDGSGSAVGAVLHVYDGRTGLSTNAMRSVTSPLVFHDHAFAFTTDELSAGAELNGDGDQDDLEVFQLYDLVLGGIVSVPLAILGQPLGANVDDWLVLVSEPAQADDLNGDGDEQDGVYFRVEPHLGSFLPAGLSAENTLFSRTDGARVLVLATEIDGVDRNQDADFLDVYDAVIQPGVAPTFVADLPHGFLPPVLSAGHVAFLVSEDELGDRNGNGVAGEGILHFMDAASGAVMATDLEALTLDAAGERVAFARFETNGTIQEDRNGDGDLDDLVFSYLDPLTGTLGGTNLAAGGALLASAGFLLVPTRETAQGEDLNGDGDQDDLVWVRHALDSGTNVPVAAGGASTANAGLLDDGRGVLLVEESSQGQFPGTDLNAEGDAFDLVLHSFRAP
jgi:hypothetical protein